MAEAFYPAEEQTMPTNFNLDLLWNQSLKVAAAARRIAEVEAEGVAAVVSGDVDQVGELVEQLVGAEVGLAARGAAKGTS